MSHLQPTNTTSCVNDSQLKQFIAATICQQTITTMYPAISGTYINGSYNNTILLTPSTDNYIPFNNEFMYMQLQSMNMTNDICFETVTVHHNDVKVLKDLLKTYINKRYNIILDGRLTKLISIAVLLLHDEVLIYDPFSLRIMNIYNYTSDICKISITEMTLYRIIMLHAVKLLLSFITFTGITVDVTELFKHIIASEDKHYTSPEIVLFYNYLKPRYNVYNNPHLNDSCSDVPVNKVIQQYFNTIIELNDDVLSKEQWNLNGVSYQVFITALYSLLNHELPTVY